MYHHCGPWLTSNGLASSPVAAGFSLNASFFLTVFNLVFPLSCILSCYRSKQLYSSFIKRNSYLLHSEGHRTSISILLKDFGFEYLFNSEITKTLGTLQVVLKAFCITRQTQDFERKVDIVKYFSETII